MPKKVTFTDTPQVFLVEKWGKEEIQGRKINHNVARIMSNHMKKTGILKDFYDESIEEDMTYYLEIGEGAK
ncbi:MAG: hypothetical protein CMM25_05400 [Rhodospirillaceae bacterium]|nr:hypothetical protein [Rhodospirillaceae bacterium]|tara:strand:+ start:235 stop:447 length:213 start_codon:yes stop_codon:yes gene_type:complete